MVFVNHSKARLHERSLLLFPTNHSAAFQNVARQLNQTVFVQSDLRDKFELVVQINVCTFLI